MIRNLKVLGLSLAAVFAMSAVASSNAAAAVEFHSEIAETALKGEQSGTNVFHAGVGHDLSCTTAKYIGEQTTATATNVEVRPSFSGCTAFGFSNTDVNTNQCTLWIEAATQTGWYEDKNHTGACPSIEITPTVFGSSQCTVTIKPGTTHYSLDIANEGSGSTRDLKIAWTFTGVPYEEHLNGGCGVGSGSNGSLTGVVTVKGFNSSGTQKGIWRL